MRILAVFNRDGGTFRTLDMDAFIRRADEIAALQGADLVCREVGGGELIAELERAAADPWPDALLAGGGDGTVSAAAAICWRSGKPLAVLPAGTMNLVARTLRVPLDLEQALAAIFGGRFYVVDIATANGRPFLHQFSVGLHARLIRLREAIAYSSRWQKMFATLRSIAGAVSRPLRFEVDLTFRTGRKKRFASGVSVTNNLLGEGHFPHADVVDGGVLGVYVAKPMNPLRTAAFCLRVIAGRWKNYQGVSEEEVTEVTLTFPRRKRTSQAVVDGELIPLEPLVHLQIHPRALRVLAPQELAAELVNAVDGSHEPPMAALP